MYPYHLQILVNLVINASLFAWLLVRLVTPAEQREKGEWLPTRSLVFLTTAVGFLGLRHLIWGAIYFTQTNWPGSFWRPINMLFPLLQLACDLGFAAFLAAAIWPKLPGSATVVATDKEMTQPRQAIPTKIDWPYTWKIVRLMFFRVVGLLLLVGATPLALYQKIFGVALMAVSTACGCLWLGLHRRSPLAIKYATAAEEE